MIGDGHAAVYPQNYLTMYPVYPYWFKDGLYIIATAEEDKDILNTEIIEIDSLTLEQSSGILRSVISYNNEWGFTASYPNYFIGSEMMGGYVWLIKTVIFP